MQSFVATQHAMDTTHPHIYYIHHTTHSHHDIHTTHL